MLDYIANGPIPSFSYDRDFGGVFYLYLRGMHPKASPSNGVFFTKPPEKLILELDRLMNGGGM